MQIKELHKSKKIFWLIGKFLIVLVALLFLIHKLKGFQSDGFLEIYSQLLNNSNDLLLFLIIILFPSYLNWHFEFLKWKWLVNSIYPISYKTVARQSLLGLVSSIATPAKAGDYLSKTLFFPKTCRLKITVLNAINNTAQLAVTVIFGSIGCLILYQSFPIFQNLFNSKDLRLSVLIAFGFGVVLYLIWKFVIKKKLNSLKIYELKVSKILIYKVLFLAFVRYMVFSFQFYAFLLIVKIELSYSWAMVLISSLYLINSVIPTSAIYDSVVKGSLAVFLFGLAQIEPWPVLFVVFIMWFANYLIPSLIGAFHLFKIKPNLKVV
jgi:hypothetical protein